MVRLEARLMPRLWCVIQCLAACSHLRDGAPTPLADSASPACAAQVRADGCDYYDCLDAQMNCGAQGYPVGYGRRYCDKFNGGCLGQLTSDAAKEWVHGTTLCLQKELATHQPPFATCAEVASTAFASHSYCYTNGSVENGGRSFCTLLPSEWNAARQCVDTEDRLSNAGLKQLAVTAWRCAGFFSFGLGLGGPIAEPDPQTAALIDDMTPAARAARAAAFESLAKELEERTRDL